MRQPILLLGTLLLAACAGTKSAPDVIPYTLDTCIIMDSKLGSMGDPVVRVYQGQEIKFCCQPCSDEFDLDPEYYLENLKRR